MRRIGIGSSAYPGTETQCDYSLVASHGYQAVDYQSFCDIATPFFQLQEKKFVDVLLREKKAADRAGVVISQTHAPWRYPPKDNTAENRAEWLKAMKKALLGSSVLESPYMVIHPIMPFGPDDDPDPALFNEMNLEFMDNLRETARDRGVMLCLENMPMKGLSISRVEPTLKMVKTLGEKDFGFCLDTGHAAVFGDDPGEMVRYLGTSLKVLHVHDNNGQSDLHWLPYQGVINWQSFKNALQESESQAVVSIETEVKKTLPAPLKEKYQRLLADMAHYLAE